MGKVNEFWIRVVLYLLIYIVFVIIHISIFGLSNKLPILLVVMVWIYSYIAYKISDKLLNRFVVGEQHE